MARHETVATALDGLKDFQRRTVDYVFDRLYGERHTPRFLVADEVGLGKTLVARGVIARAYEHLRRKKSRIDVIYVCSNAAIQTQNVNRLNLFGQPEFAMPTRLTLLPAEVHRLTSNHVNFISLTPGTAFNLKSRGGLADERALLCRMLLDGFPELGSGIRNLLQGSVTNRDRWIRLLKDTSKEFDDELARAFCSSLKADRELFTLARVIFRTSSN